MFKGEWQVRARFSEVDEMIALAPVIRLLFERNAFTGQAEALIRLQRLLRTVLKPSGPWAVVGTDVADDLVASIQRDEPGEFSQGRPARVIKDDHAADIHQLIDEEKIDQGMIERVLTIYEGKIDPGSRGQQFRQRDL